MEVLEVRIHTTIGNPGTGLSCAIVTGVAAGNGMRWAGDDARATGHDVRLRHVVGERVRLSRVDIRPVTTDLLAAKQPKNYVPRPPHERGP